MKYKLIDDTGAFTINSDNSIAITRRDSGVLKIIFSPEDFSLYGCTLIFFIKKKPTDPDNLAVFKDETQSFLTSEDNVVDIYMSSEQTDLPVGTYYYGVKVTNTDGHGFLRAKTIFNNRFYITQEMVNRTEIIVP